MDLIYQRKQATAVLSFEKPCPILRQSRKYW
jgi:hypothetical protein